MKNRIENFAIVVWMLTIGASFYFNSVRLLIAVFVLSVAAEYIRESFYPESYKD